MVIGLMCSKKSNLIDSSFFFLAVESSPRTFASRFGVPRMHRLKRFEEMVEVELIGI